MSLRRRRRRRNRSESAGHVTDDVIGHLPLRRSSILGMRGKQCQPAGRLYGRAGGAALQPGGGVD